MRGNTRRAGIGIWFLAGVICISGGPALAQEFRATGFSATEVWTASYAKDKVPPGLFIEPAKPMRSLGGAFAQETLGIVVAAMDGNEHDWILSMGHGLATLKTVNVIGDRGADPKCSGTGDTAEDPIVASKSGMDGIEAALRCVRARHRSGTWLGSQLIAGDGEYFSLITVGQSDGKVARIYTSVTDWTEDFTAN